MNGKTAKLIRKYIASVDEIEPKNKKGAARIYKKRYNQAPRRFRAALKADIKGRTVTDK